MLGPEPKDEGMSMVSRRGLVGGAAALATALLGGCGFGRDALVANLEEAVSEVEGVTEATLELKDGANFERLLAGTVSLGTQDREDALAIFDDAMRAVVTVVHDELGDAEARSVRVGGITGVMDGGEELTPFDLDPDVQAANPRRDRITAESFYAKYGLD